MMNTREISRLLRLHARTFALTLRFLPRALREPLGLAYLLARASDMIADEGTILHDGRIALLEELRSSLDGDAFDIWQPKTHEGELSDNDGKLIRAVPQLIAALKGSPDCKELISLWRSIIKGQLSDLTRFPSEAPLKEEELERYCFLVAGSVGEIWTKLIAKHEPQTLLRPEEEMRRLGIAYGKGLQLVNILRDRVDDRSVGRHYVKDADLPALYDMAEEWLGSGEEYLTGLRPGRILMATAMPHDLAVRTLRGIKHSPNAERVSITRWEVRSVLVRNVTSLCLPRRMNPAS
jgi:farnesyl-diphosphate farnesyltransferase